jgi:pimeloyl-ACP methyl ester carboxylesterase
VRARYPHVRHVTLPQGGHYPHIVAADRLIDAMREWLR